jgi:lipopolysaccharide transport system ATP-binding protein
MSSEFSIRVEGLSKRFPVYSKPHHRLLQMFSPRPAKSRWFREFHALTGIDFEIHRGETVAIVGRNGSGKSTLLQLICGTLAPSDGSVEVNGRIAALLELGAGFNPEFTGRENVYLNGTVLGLTRSEIDACFDEIASFADIGEFIEQPVKSYSSGMYVRLAFAVAIHVMPDILVVDEALSVGDEAFQRKCFARINKIRDAGATVLFVSHAAGAVTELCNRALLLDRGELLLDGAPKFVLSRYHKMLYAPADRVTAIRESIRNHEDEGLPALETPLAASNGTQNAGADSGAADDAYDGDAYLDEGLVPRSTLSYEALGAVVEDARIETLRGRRVNVLKSGDRYVYVYNVRFHAMAQAVRFGMLIKTVTGLELGGGQSATLENTLPLVEAGSTLTVRFHFRCMMAPGPYFLNAGVLGRMGDGEVYLNRQIDIAMFRVMPDAQRLATAMVDFEISPSVDV